MQKVKKHILKYKIPTCLFLFVLIIGCKGYSYKFRVVSIKDSLCSDTSKYHIILSKPLRFKKYQILSNKTSDSLENKIQSGDKLHVNLIKMKPIEWLGFNMQGEFSYSCNDSVILKDGQSFYKTDDIVGLQVVNPKNIKRKAKQ